MTDLRDQFNQVVRDARDSIAHFSQPPETYYNSLWQVIAGPSRSGKSTRALEYADALDLVGITRGMPRFMSGASTSGTNCAQMFRDIKQGTLIIDEPEKFSDRDRADVYRHLVEAYDKQSCVVVITGDKPAIESFIADMPPELKSRWTPEVRETTHVFTAEECAEFDAERKAARETSIKHAEQQLKRAAEMKKWRDLPEVDVSVPQTVKAMKPVRFTPAKPMTVKAFEAGLSTMHMAEIKG